MKDKHLSWEEYMAENQVHTIDSEMAQTLIGMLKAVDKSSREMALEILSKRDDLPETSLNFFRIQSTLIREGQHELAMKLSSIR